jgi:energy-coupling factor transporter ATP-binding protein EcfA2
MKINRFVATDVHGYLNFDLHFFPDLNFLTGINGSGKTSVVNGITALISPSVLMLANTTYSRMEIEIIQGGNKISIWSTRDEESIQLGCSETPDSLGIMLFPKDAFEALPTYRVREEQIKYYREQEAVFSSHPVLKLVKSLPTPMFLDIERRIEDMPNYRMVSHSVRRRSQNIFSTSLSRSLLEATGLAESRFRRIQASQRELTDKLRKDIILSAVQYETSEKSRYTFPELGERYLETKKNQVTSTLRMLGLSEDEVLGQLDPFFEKLKQLADRIPANKDMNAVLREGADAHGSVDTDASFAIVSAFADWMANKPQFDRIMMISRHADDYVKRSQGLNQEIDEYLASANQFLHDSGKEIAFNETGDLAVRLRGASAGPITSLSSGESQIVVILTHLTFNPAARLASVFIVDEPELSLHVRWQELFVEAVKTAGPQLQIILATHSPSIILDDLAHCIDLSARGDEAS